MSSRVARLLSWVILLVIFLGTFIAYPSLPAVMVTHFNMNGAANGTSSALVGAFILPFITLLIFLLFALIPRIDPLRVNIQQFRPQYDTFVALLMLFFAVIQSAIISRNLGVLFDPRLVVLPAVGILMFYVGVLLPKTRRNWFIGIRTPWTISSDHVWQKTHRLGGTLFKLFGIAIVLSTFVPAYAVLAIVILLIALVLGLVVYSYVLYERERTI